MIKKPWGHEIIWAQTDKYVGKILFIKAGHRLSLQHHQIKDETIMVMDGYMQLELEDEAGQIWTRQMVGTQERKDSQHILPGRKHRMKALSDVTIVEVSTPELEDVVRWEDDYGRVD